LTCWGDRERGGFGLIGDIVVGIIGSLIGGWLFGPLGIAAGGPIGSIMQQSWAPSSDRHCPADQTRVTASLTRGLAPEGCEISWSWPP
jgi:hypothetical protein